MYYNFKVEISVSTYNEKKNTFERHWKTLFKQHLGDMPHLLFLQWALGDALNAKYQPDWQRDILQNGDVMYSKLWEPSPILIEDEYSITKSVIPAQDREEYLVTFGLAVDGLSNSFQGASAILSREEAERLKHTIDEFIQTLIFKQNQRTRENNRNDRGLYNPIDHERLFRYSDQEKKTFDNLYKFGDTVTITALPVKDGDDAKKTLYSGIIADIDAYENTIRIVGANGSSTIPLSDIIYIDRTPTDTELSYTEDEIRQEISSFLDEIGHIWTAKEAKDQYAEILINRFWMCRDEHPFQKDDGKNYKRARKIARNIIKKIWKEQRI